MNTTSRDSISSLKLFAGLWPLSRTGAAHDALAGLQLAVMNIPQALGYTKIAGMPVVTGLYTLLLPQLAFAMFGSSRYLVVAADSATAVIMAGGLAGMAPVASARYVALAGAVALLTAGLLLIARLLKLGFLADFLSQTVLVGFLTGVGFQVGIAVLGEMVGVEVHSHRTIDQLTEIFRNLTRIHILTASLSFLVVATVLVLHRFAPKMPGSLIAVTGTIAASVMWNLAGHGVVMIGLVTGGLPRLTLPAIGWREIEPLIPIAGSCFVMIVAQSSATARFYATRHQQHLDEDTDLIGLSAANAAAALSGTFVVDGSPTQTAMVESSGGQSQVAQMTTAGLVAFVLLFMTRPLQYLPRCVLGSVVFVIAVRLIDVQSLRDIQRESPGEHALALLTAAAVVLVGVGQAIVLAMVLSLLRVLQHSYHPQTGVLVANEHGWLETIPPVAGAVTQPGLAIYRFGAALFYANADRFSQEIRELVGTTPSKVRWLIVDAEAITNIDYTAARMVRQLHAHLMQSGVEFAFARMATSLRSDLIRHRLVEVIGPGRIYPRLHEAVAAFAAGEEARFASERN
jgi:MFS superfamily sulfate permease-like transporter